MLLLIGIGGGAGADATTAPAALAPSARQCLESITGGEVISHAKILTDPKFHGREASTPGGRKAAKHIAEAFRRIGLRAGGSAGSYFQVFKILPGYRVSSRLSLSLGQVDPRGVSAWRALHACPSALRKGGGPR